MASRGLLIVCVLIVFAASADGAVVGLEDLRLEDESYWNGSDGSGGFTSGPARFSNNYNEQFGSWDGFSYSNITDTGSRGWAAQYNAIAGSGAGGSANYAMYYRGYGDVPSVTFEAPVVVEGMYVTNNNYAYYSMLEGDAYSKKFGGADGTEEDWFVLTVTGRDSAGDSTGTVEFYLADLRSADSAGDYIVDTWEYVGLSELGPVMRLEFTVDSSDVGAWGMNTPGYFALDDMTIVPEPGSAVLLALGVLGAARKRRMRA